MTDAEKELITIKHRVRTTLAGFEAIVESYRGMELDAAEQAKLAAYELAVDGLRKIDPGPGPACKEGNDE